MTDKTTKESFPRNPPPVEGFSGSGSRGHWSEGSQGKTFQDWKLEQQFPAKGGEADVFLVSRGFEKRVLKLYRYGIAPKKEVFDGISRLSEQHPDLFIRVFEFGNDPQTDCFYELEEFASQGNLADFLVGKKLDEGQVSMVVERIARSLFVLHDNGILHLDLKPANVLLRSSFPLDPIVSDFGISSVFDAEVSKKLTQTKGTSLYQSPESITGVVIPKSDWWSLGIIALELLMGRHPFEGLQRQVILYQLTTQGVEIPASLAPRWQNLLMGLLTRNPDKRWGTEHVKRWLEGKTVETSYQEEMAQTHQKQGGADLSLSSSFKRFDKPFHLDNTAYTSLEDLLEGIFSSPNRWEEGKIHLCRGKIATWLEENSDQERATELRRLMEEIPDPHRLIFKAGVFFRSDLSFCWRGALLDGNRLLGFLEAAGFGTEAPEDRPLIEGLFSGDLFQDYIRFTGRDLGSLEPLWRFSQALKGTDLEKLPLAEKSRLLVLASTGKFSSRHALEAIQDAFSETPGHSEILLKYVQTKAFAGFAQRTGLWQPGDSEIWNMVTRIAAKSSQHKGVDVGPLLAQTENVLTAAKKDPTLREFIVKIFSKNAIDLAFIRQLQQYLQGNPWLDSLIRGVYHLPPKESLDFCLGNLMVSASLSSKWADLNRKYLLPPFFTDLIRGKMVSPGQLKFAREILDQPDVLIQKSTGNPTWESLTDNVYPPTGMSIDSVEYLNLLRRERAKKTGQTVLGVFSSIVSLCVKAFLLMFFGLIFLEVFFPWNRGRPREGAREKSCYANMRVILGAVEMYNMDNQTMISTTLLWDRLTGNAGYLRQLPNCPGNGQYSVVGDLASDGRVLCSSHGTVD